MKKVIALALLLAFAGMMLAGCTTSNSVPGPTDEPNSSPLVFSTVAPIDPEDAGLDSVLFWETFRSGSDAGHRLTYRVYADSKEFLNDFPDRGEEFNARYGEKSFEDMFVVAAFITVNTGGYSYELVSGSTTRSSVQLNITENAPEPGTMVTQAFETHCILAAFPREAYSEGMTVTVLLNGTPVTDLPVGGETM